MKQWKTILVPTDFSPCSREAVKLAAEIAQESGGVLHLLHVVEVPAGLEPHSLVHVDGVRNSVTVEQAAHEAAEQLLAEHRGAIGSAVQVHTLSITGEAVPDVLAMAEKLGADLLVVGTHGRRGLSHLLLGSVAERLVRLANVPVLTVRKKTAEGAAK